jgi:hypothetical protein
MSSKSLRPLKHSSTGFFTWMYYPLTRHTRTNITALFKKIYSIESLVTDSQIEKFLRKGDLYLQAHHDATDTEDSLYLVVNGVGTSTFPDGDPSYGDPFDRHGMVSLILMDYNSYINHDKQRSVNFWFNDVDIIIEHFEPFYGFGHIQFNRWCDNYNRIPPPEIRIWPYNLFNLEAYPSGLKGRLEDFIEDNAHEWDLRYIGDNMVELRTKDLRRKETDIGHDITWAILGEGDEILTPKVGYPPLERWWD